MAQTTRPILGLLLVAGAAAGCDGAPVAVPGPPMSTPPPPAVENRHDSHYRGSAAIGEAAYRYHAEALFTAGGEVLLHVGGPDDTQDARSGAGISAAALEPAEAALFVGNVSWTGAQGSGQGVVIGERCMASNPGRFCGAAVAAELNVSQTGRTIAGELRVTTGGGVETWALDIGDWSLYYDSSSSAGFRGRMYRERLAPFAEPGDPIISVDADGRLFFQSAASGCTGNGTVAPHADGRFYVFNVDLVIENCDTEYAYLNGRFEGLATESQDNYWGYDSWLLMLLSTPDGSAARVALTTLAEAL
jgi:hypothetical protein